MTTRPADPPAPAWPPTGRPLFWPRTSPAHHGLVIAERDLHQAPAKFGEIADRL